VIFGVPPRRVFPRRHSCGNQTHIYQYMPLQRPGHMNAFCIQPHTKLANAALWSAIVRRPVPFAKKNPPPLASNSSVGHGSRHPIWDFSWVYSFQLSSQGRFLCITCLPLPPKETKCCYPSSQAYSSSKVKTKCVSNHTESNNVHASKTQVKMVVHHAHNIVSGAKLSPYRITLKVT
jgi:hypothetical protein